MSFKFSLATVLKVRESVERREERVLQKIQLEIARTLRQADELVEQISRTHEARERLMQQATAASNLHTLLEAAQAMSEQRLGLLERVQVLEQERAKQMKVYQAAHRDREMLTDMQMRQRDTYEKELERTRQKQLDDLFMARRHQANR